MAKKTKVILLDNVRKLGNKGDIVEVSVPYANNVLIGKGLARIADQGTINKVKQEQDRKQKQSENIKQSLNEVVDKGGISVKKKATSNEKLYDKVGVDDIKNELKNQYGVEVDSDSIKLDKKLEFLGTYHVNVKYKDFEGDIPVDIIKE